MKRLTHLQRLGAATVRPIGQSFGLCLLLLAWAALSLSPAATAQDILPDPTEAEALGLLTAHLCSPDKTCPVRLQFRYKTAPRFTAQIIQSIRESRCMAAITVVDEHRRPVAGATVVASDLFLQIHARSDGLGTCRIPLYPGQWNLRVVDQGYLNAATDFDIIAGQTEMALTHAVHCADALISGIVEGDVSQLLTTPAVTAYHYESGTGRYYYSERHIQPDGSFRLPVSSRLDSYTVVLEGWFIPADYVIVPPLEGADYRYRDVKAGQRDVAFRILPPDGRVSGVLPRLAATAGQGSGLVRFSDARQQITVFTPIAADGSFSAALPRGSYEISAEFPSPDTTARLQATVTVGQGEDVVTLLSNDGLSQAAMPALETIPVLSASVRFSGGIPTLLLTSPIDGIATLQLFEPHGRQRAVLYQGPVGQGSRTIALGQAGLGRSLQSSGYLLAHLTIMGRQRYSQCIRIPVLH